MFTKYSAVIALLLLSCMHQLIAQNNIVKMEYYLDNDPGFGNGINIPITPASNISNLQVSIPNTPASQFVYIRCKDQNGSWSVSHKIRTPQKINKIEYFIGNDPGAGNGIDVPFVAGTDVQNIPINIPYQLGARIAFVRTRNSYGTWSVIMPVKLNEAKINYAEYFIDNDPGFGNGINIPISAGTNIQNIPLNIPFQNGMHKVFFRTRDGFGKWSVTQEINPPKSKITYLEYFIDNDPGFGNGTSIPVTASSNISNVALNISNLPWGFHVVFVRSRNAHGEWSVSNPQVILRDSLKCYLQGYYAGNGFMTPALMNQGVGNDPATVDSILIQLRNPNYPYEVVTTANALLKTDGTFVAMFQGFDVTGTQFYMVVKHRNSAETWSAAPINIMTENSYDFTNAISKAYGNNQKEVEPGVFAIYSGDINQDENIDLLDATVQENDINQFQFGYYATDINGDGNVDLLDAPIVETNINQFVFSSHP